MSSLTSEPLISPALWASLALLATCLLIWYARSRPAAVPGRRWMAIIGLMTLGAAAILAILLNPTWLEPVPPPAGKPLLTVLVDQSASMGVSDLAEGKSRWAGAVDLAAAAEKEFAPRFDVQIHKFSESWSAATSTELASTRPEGISTNLAAAIAGALTADKPQGQAMLLISDGIHNAPGGIAPLFETLRSAKAMDAPVYTMTLGGASTLRDLEIAVSRPQELAFVGQRVPIPVVLRQRGRLTDRAEVILMHEGQEVARQTQALPPDGKAMLRFSVAENQSGLYRYDVHVDPQASEATSANNSASFLLRVVDNPVRVLLLEGKPYWDGKFLIRTLAADPSLELDAIVRVTDSRFLMRSLRLDRTTKTAAREDASPAAPEREAPHVLRVESSSILHDPQELLEGAEGLSTYQLVVLGRDAEAFLNPQFLERLRTWISRDGGSLICYRGSPVAQVTADLARIMPVRWSPSRETRFRVKVTERGSDLSWLKPEESSADDVFGRLPSLATSAPAEEPKPLSVVLARSEADEGPAVVSYQSYGTGRVVAVEGAGMWRWAFLSPQYQQHDRVYESLWQSLLRWLVSSVGLVPGQDLVLRTDKVTYNIGESVSALLLRRDDSAATKALEVELTDRSEEH